MSTFPHAAGSAVAYPRPVSANRPQARLRRLAAALSRRHGERVLAVRAPEPLPRLRWP